MAITVKITETYDMKTTVGKVGLVGIHTPSASLIRKLYPGLMINHRFIRFLKCDVVGACATTLPADPLQVGVSAGEVAPEDMFNPILYTAVTNESFDTIVARIRAITDISPLNSVASGNAVPTEPSDRNFKLYYALLAENGKYRKVMPQAGFVIKNLVPLAHTLVSPFGNVGPQGNTTVLSEDGETPVSVPDMTVPELANAWGTESDNTIFYRGKTVRMPRFPIHSAVEDTNPSVPFPNIPKTNVLAMIIPPGKLHEFYYRVRVTWYARFEELCSTLEAGAYSIYQDVGGSSYGTNYSYSSSKADMDNETDMIDANDVNVNKIMES